MDSACGICFASRIHILGSEVGGVHYGDGDVASESVRDLLSTQRKLWVPSESVRMSREPIGRTDGEPI